MKLTDERIKEVQSETYRKLVAAGYTGGMGGVQWDMALSRAIEAALQPDFCDKNCTWRDHHPDCERAEPVQEPDVPFPGMQEEFEAYYSQSFIDRDWRREAGVWAASWKAATRYTAPPDQTAEIERLREELKEAKQNENK